MAKFKYDSKILDAVNRYYGNEGKNKLTMKDLENMHSDTIEQSASMALRGGKKEFESLLLSNIPY